MNTERINIRISASEKKKLQKLAEENGLTISSYIKMIIAQNSK